MKITASRIPPTPPPPDKIVVTIEFENGGEAQRYANAVLAGCLALERKEGPTSYANDHAMFWFCARFQSALRGSGVDV